VQHVSDLHPKFATKPTQKKKKKKKKKKKERKRNHREKYNDLPYSIRRP